MPVGNADLGVVTTTALANLFIAVAEMDNVCLVVSDLAGSNYGGGQAAQDGVIKRFHKGAFFLAEKLNLDILPILIHGTGYTMTKNDFLLKDGRITLKYLPRITRMNTNF